MSIEFQFYYILKYISLPKRACPDFRQTSLDSKDFVTLSQNFRKDHLTAVKKNIKEKQKRHAYIQNYRKSPPANFHNFLWNQETQETLCACTRTLHF